MYALRSPCVCLSTNRLCAHVVRQRTDAVDRRGDAIARLEEDAPAHTHPGRRARGNDIARLECDDRRQVSDLLAHGPNHVCGRVLLHRLVVDVEAQRNLLRVGYLPRRHDPRAERCKSVMALALEPVELERVVAAHVEIARRDVVDDRIACHCVQRTLRRDAPASHADHRSQLDLPVELAAVIGMRCRRITAERALDAVAGYSIVNDVSARDLNMRSDYPFKFDWFQGKCHDTFAPFGPWIVPAWQIPDPQKVALRLDVNDQPMQQDTTANMIWTVREQIAYLSTIVTLEPGDVIATGTPTGVGMGRGIFLKAGDRITATIDGIGTLANDVRAETIRT